MGHSHRSATRWRVRRAPEGHGGWRSCQDITSCQEREPLKQQQREKPAWNLNASNSLTTSDSNTEQPSKKNLPDGANSKEGFMIAIDTSKTSIVDSLVSIAAEEASFVPGRWERSFRRLGGKGEEGSMGL